MIKPSVLQKGDSIAIIAPSSSFPKDSFIYGIKQIESMGFNIYYNESIFQNKDHYLAGSVERRLSEWNSYWLDDNVKAIFCARGGYGAMELLDSIDFSVSAKHPKIFMGCSDITPILNMISQKSKLIAFHGPVVCGIGNTNSESIEYMWRFFKGLIDFPVNLWHEQIGVLVHGTTQGELCGGNLTLITSTMGTPYDISMKDKILCIEDVGERPYRIDRMIRQLYLSGKLRELKAVIIGEMWNCKEQNQLTNRPLEDIFMSFFKELNIPVIVNMPFGHGKQNYLIPFGATLHIHTEKKELVIQEPVLK